MIFHEVSICSKTCYIKLTISFLHVLHSCPDHSVLTFSFCLNLSNNQKNIPTFRAKLFRRVLPSRNVPLYAKSYLLGFVTSGTKPLLKKKPA